MVLLLPICYRKDVRYSARSEFHSAKPNQRRWIYNLDHLESGNSQRLGQETATAHYTRLLLPTPSGWCCENLLGSIMIGSKGPWACIQGFVAACLLKPFDLRSVKDDLSSRSSSSACSSERWGGRRSRFSLQVALLLMWLTQRSRLQRCNKQQLHCSEIT